MNAILKEMTFGVEVKKPQIWALCMVVLSILAPYWVAGMAITVVTIVYGLKKDSEGLYVFLQSFLISAALILIIFVSILLLGVIAAVL